MDSLSNRNKLYDKNAAMYAKLRRFCRIVLPPGNLLPGSLLFLVNRMFTRPNKDKS